MALPSFRSLGGGAQRRWCRRRRESRPRWRLPAPPRPWAPGRGRSSCLLRGHVRGGEVVHGRGGRRACAGRLAHPRLRRPTRAARPPTRGSRSAPPGRIGSARVRRSADAAVMVGTLGRSAAGALPWNYATSLWLGRPCAPRTDVGAGRWNAMCPRWLSTVLTLVKSAVATSPLRLPEATRSAMRRSTGVRLGGLRRRPPMAASSASACRSWTAAHGWELLPSNLGQLAAGVER